MTDCTKIINDISRNWKLTNAQYANDGPDHKAGETRTDGRYPIRIGSTYTCLSFVGIGRSVIMPYLKDFMGRNKTGYVTTSPLVEIELPEVVEDGKTQFRFKTLNTIYTMVAVD